MTSRTTSYSYEIYIGATLSRVWKGLIDGELTKHYVYGTRFESELKKGAPYAYLGDDYFKIVDGEILDVEPERKLSMTWNAHWDGHSANDRPSPVTYELSSLTGVTDEASRSA